MITLIATDSLPPEERGVKQEGPFLETHVTWLAEGFTTRRREYPYEGRTCGYDEVVFPEVGPSRIYPALELQRGLRLRIEGRLYRVKVRLNQYEREYPEGATVAFEPLTGTCDTETVYTPWFEAQAREDLIARLRESIADRQAYLASKTDPSEELSASIPYWEKRVLDLTSGEERVHPNGDVIAFGQPDFIQNPTYPALSGKAARCLMVINNDWGDSGNVNLFFACDADGIPCKVWLEASCC